ncbi:unnamed protein product [Bursaphelenchus okinawaensis]|uniref:Uncharacterized protein n=1 Tax=Bursaphelenchus okinawaensis TaxID=465554 RepID=A0A811L1C2_9BILA|nr:unnamed protein product [Bursaphelenchus okinawaensis]CAG9115179.1 unnamed protein product [Bursaphelenchus okinawaensis]
MCKIEDFIRELLEKKPFEIMHANPFTKLFDKNIELAVDECIDQLVVNASKDGYINLNEDDEVDKNGTEKTTESIKVIV